MNVRTAVLGVTFVWLGLGVQAQDQDWTPIGRDDGFVISHRSGHGLPAFRGVGPVHGSVQEVLSVIRDVPSLNQWAFGISKSELIRKVSPQVDLIYLLSKTPWPIRDRDMTVRREIRELSAGSAYRISWRCQSGLRPVRRGVVRVSRCRSEFHLRRLSERETEVEYWALLDPGRVPSWASTWMARMVPGRTLVALQQRVTKLSAR